MSEEAEEVRVAKALLDVHEVLSEAVADRIVGVLNEALKLDYDATVGLIFGDHIPCNEALADHPTIKVRCISSREGKEWGVRVMGLLNGLTGAYPDGFGRVAGNFEVVCPEHGVNKGKGVVGDNCPVSKCSRLLELGKLIEFIRPKAEDHQIPEPVGEA